MAVEVRRKQGLQTGQTLTMHQTSFIVDVPAAGGGDDAGPSPHDLYDAALGACKALTVTWFANRKRIPIDDLTVSVERDDSQERAGTYKLTAKILIRGALSDAQISELRVVAEKCPIHKLMTAVDTAIQTEVERMS
jgi:putative redox protein